MVQDGLRRRNFRVTNINVSGTATGNLANQIMTNGDTWYVDASKATGASGDGTTWGEAFITIAEAITAASRLDVIYIAAKDITDQTGDPNSYAETLIIPNTHDGLALIGVSRGRTQGGLPQIKKGSGSTALLTIRAPGCLIASLGFNGAGSTGGGILLDDDYSAKAAFGTSIIGCHLKNCKVSTTDSRTGGAIYNTTDGNCWQCYFAYNDFYKCVADIVMRGTGNTIPQNWVIEHNVFSGPNSAVDCNVNIVADGVNGLVIRNNVFPAFPTLSSGSVLAPLFLTGSIGILSNNQFGFPTQGSGRKTFGAAANIKVPTTMIMTGNYGEADTEGDTGYVART